MIFWGSIVRSADDVEPGAELTTTVADGTITSTITATEAPGASDDG